MITSRTAILATRIFEPEAGAAAYRLAALVRALEIAGIRTTVLTTQPRERVSSTRWIRRWPVVRDREGGSRGYLKYATFDIPLFFRLLFGPRPQAIIVEPPPSTGFVTRIAAALRGVPYIYFAADVSSSAAAGVGINPLVVRVVRFIERFALRGASAVLSVSTGVSRELIALGVDPRRITLVGTGIDTRRFPAAGPVAEPGYPYFVYAGTMSEIQGAGVFLEAFGRLATQNRDVRLHLFGHGVELPALTARAAELGAEIGPGRISFGGMVPSEELTPWLRGAVASLASVRPLRGYDFAFATKALASLSCGTPVIFAGVGPLRSLVIGHLLGWSSEWDVDCVEASMREALATRMAPVERARLSGWVARHHSSAAVAQTAVDLVSDVIDSREARRVRVGARPSRAGVRGIRLEL